MIELIVIVSVGLGVTALVAGAAMFLQPVVDNTAEDRLSALTGNKKKGATLVKEQAALFAAKLEDSQSLADEILSRLGNVRNIMAQADVKMSGSKFLTICVGCSAVGSAICLATPTPKLLLPVFAIVPALLPLLWLIMKRKKRLARFSSQLPEALELLSRSLRAGHSLAAGFSLVASEMQDPLAKEFGRVFEEQNLGISFEEALEEMTNRVPNLDLRFFATAVTLQRQTGGDLAEILDKIGHLIRERFKLAGQIQALTGEGRLSGIVLLALPPGLFLVMLYLNHDYAMVLFNDPTGRKLSAGALALQLVGALVIRKIINIKV
ncbi:MAG: type II secretion system F family protein [Planctomycetales bacterium]|nr:type II secretion system F family protein [Planctomycetales bacterium]